MVAMNERPIIRLRPRKIGSRAPKRKITVSTLAALTDPCSAGSRVDSGGKEERAVTHGAGGSWAVAENLNQAEWPSGLVNSQNKNSWAVEGPTEDYVAPARGADAKEEGLREAGFNNYEHTNLDNAAKLDKMGRECQATKNDSSTIILSPEFVNRLNLQQLARELLQTDETWTWAPKFEWGRRRHSTNTERPKSTSIFAGVGQKGQTPLRLPEEDIRRGALREREQKRSLLKNNKKLLGYSSAATPTRAHVPRK